MEVGAKEMSVCRNTLLAFLDYLVGPLLPYDPILKEGITLSPQEMVASQVHAVVLLYNYYHRKQNPGVAFLEFETFCKLAVDLKPSLGLFFSVMQKTDCFESEEQDKDFSLTEKAIMSACEISRSLNALYNKPNFDGWPITRVSVFLVDSQKENCGLFFGSITQGVWSAIEKEINYEKQLPEGFMDASAFIKRKKRVMKRKDATALLQLAYLAVKEKCGIDEADLIILDNHVVYSTSKLKTTVRLYIMQMRCTQTNKEMTLIPIKEVMDYLQGSLIVDKEFVSPVVEYFHLLPFADTVLDWLKREMSQDPLVSKTLEVLYKKREELCQNLGDIADEKALCEQKIKTILGGSEDHLAVKLETSVVGEDHSTPVVKGKRLSEANLSVLGLCEELDGICSRNLWMFPTYSLSSSEDGFNAIVKVKGVDFECSSEGTICTTPHEARNSAASNILAKLRSLAAKS